jgi:hypothetical protein
MMCIQRNLLPGGKKKEKKRKHNLELEPGWNLTAMWYSVRQLSYVWKLSFKLTD